MPVLLHTLVIVMGWFGGAQMVETSIENYLANAPWMPKNLKGAIVPFISLVGAVIASIYGGIDPLTAFLGAIGFGGTVGVLHNIPATTSAEIPLPPPPVDPLGVPGDLPGPPTVTVTVTPQPASPAGVPSAAPVPDINGVVILPPSTPK